MIKFSLKIITLLYSIVFVILFILYLGTTFIGNLIHNQDKESSKVNTTNSTPTKPQEKSKKYVFNSNGKAVEVDEDAKEIPCSRCNGTGIFTCEMCGGTGTNNLGSTCGCVTYVLNCQRIGTTPSRPALRWSCEYCNGTGSTKIK